MEKEHKKSEPATGDKRPAKFDESIGDYTKRHKACGKERSSPAFLGHDSQPRGKLHYITLNYIILNYIDYRQIRRLFDDIQISSNYKMCGHISIHTHGMVRGIVEASFELLGPRFEPLPR